MNEMYVNDETVSLDVPAKLYGGRTFAPIRIISESLGADVQWDSASRLITISWQPTMSNE
jgi:hypothetical protein